MENDNPLGLNGPDEMYLLALELEDALPAAEPDSMPVSDTPERAGEAALSLGSIRLHPPAIGSPAPARTENDSDTENSIPADTSANPASDDSAGGSYMPMTALPADRQPREKALKYGCGALSNHELLAIILRTGTPGYRITDMTADLLRVNGNSLLRLARREISELKRIRGLGDTKALQILALMEIGRRMAIESVGEKPVIRNSADIYSLMKPIIANLDHEEIHIVMLNRRNQVTATQRITSGSPVASLFDVKMILRSALLEQAQNIIMCHNHPSGNLTPSPQDDNITRLLSQACRTVDLRMLDHVIVTNEGYYSYADKARL